MSEYISKQSLLDKTVNKNHAWLYTTNAEGKNLKEIVDELPSADVRPNIHGHWIRVTDKAGHLVWKCDKCGWQKRLWTNYCPDCGADMREPIGEKGET